MTVIQISELRRINYPKVSQFWLLILIVFCLFQLFVCCVTCVLVLCYLCVYTNGKKWYGWSAGNSFSCSAKMASAANFQDRPVPSSIARDWSLQSTSGKYKRRGNSDTVNCELCLGCVYLTHASASNMTVYLLLARKVLILTQVL